MQTGEYGKPEEVLLDHCAGLCGELHVVVSSQKSADPNKQEGVNILLSGLFDGFLVLVEDLNQKKGKLPLHVSTAGFHIILIMIIVNKVHEK